MSAGDPNGNSDEEDEEPEQQGEEQSEQQELEVVEEQNSPTNGPTAQPSEAIENLSTYTTEIGDLTARIIPQFTRFGTDWVLNVYAPTGQGPILQTQDGITDEQAADIGISMEEVRDLNSLLARANDELELPRSLRGQPRAKKTVDELERVLS